MDTTHKMAISVPNAVSLFAGAGGCSLGFQKAGYQILYALDSDIAAVETYRANFADTICVQGDVREFDFGTLLDNLKIEAGELDILIGGPPCQGFSTAGAKFWDDPRNSLLKSYVKSLEIMRPKWFIMENVEGLLTAKSGEYIYEATKAFVELGYRVRIDKIYAHEYGVPQRRKRVLVIGNRLGHDFNLPQPIKHIHGAIFRKSSSTLRHAIGDLPEPSVDKNQIVRYSGVWKDEIRDGTKKIKDHFSPLLHGTQAERIRALKPGQTMKDLPEELQHRSFRRRAYRRVMDGTPSEQRGGAPAGLKRLHFDEPCLTITGAACREFIHPIKDRPLTIRECARIQTFPDSFVFLGNASEKIRHIGNAIPPKLARIFAEHIKSYGFLPNKNMEDGTLIGFTLTKASAMSPVLRKTARLLERLEKRNKTQLNLFG